MDCLLLVTGISELVNPSQVYKWVDITVVIWGVYKIQGSLMRIANWLAKIKIVLMNFIAINKIPHNLRGGMISHNLSEGNGSRDTATELMATTKSKNEIKIDS